jgi:RNA polymerase sigma-70 factor (ECF subfamily)
MAQPDFGRFGSTHWSEIAAACDDETTRRNQALNCLTRRYSPALFAHLVFRRGLEHYRAEDILQSFLVERILERDFLRRADQAKGKFRSFLLRSLENFLIDTIRRDNAKAAGLGPLPQNDDGEVWVAAPQQPDVFDVVWARRTLSESLDRMQRDCIASGNADRWDLFKRRVLLPIFDNVPPEEYDRLVQRYRFSSPQQASNALITAKRQFERTVADVVAEYSDDAAEVAAEIGKLREVLAVAGPLGLTVEDISRASAHGSTSTKGSSLPNMQSMVPLAPSNGAESVTELSEHHALSLLLACEQTAGDAQWTEDELSAIWRHLLSTPLCEVISVPPTAACGRSRECLGDLLSSSSPDVAQLRQLKNYARTLVRDGGEALPPDIASALYYLAIAAALVRCGERITKSSGHVLSHGWAILQSRPMISSELRLLMARAIEHAREEPK